jgi:hypothetical protein
VFKVDQQDGFARLGICQADAARRAWPACYNGASCQMPDQVGIVEIEEIFERSWVEGVKLKGHCELPN